ncbi:nitrilase family protein [Verminephrobacter aporrectodeae]|uniref:Hydratase n=1 Tax=Verminephrobacter aporrectodeae subsp. tuberculatae TaxID=1110392 RepID=A0ABT3KWA2_9BURK|nr:nitrilase family protein [Verminephrobacter aporrectodeae]MCW5322598.1 hydratase [Verminephrobacter aporrectodeae subsp. tuberculatae]MCW8174630.1 hydratase [Verminephrobacter aporrectodeae subsp. tuberculatae]MCW8198877.1 hydratase [Verminephrobacter aporrectodeae subsp. tuberculatae]MCW8203024.1 hydratase [Verminephrobacter aporrectodeae subsp. tuberculatae]MCW8207991.1 hydratase [Verminephrobacter aporrectodeae subsp. tuberculatae]
MNPLPRGKAAQGMHGPMVACVQMAPRIGQKRENLARSIRCIEEAARNGASLVVLPELSNTGYVFSDRQEAHALAEELPHGESAQAWADAAQRLGVCIVAGIAEREAQQLYNCAIFLDPSGVIGKYRKLHLWNHESRFFTPGQRCVPVFDTPVGRISLAICYDGWFPEVFRLAAIQGADIVCVPTNWVPMPQAQGLPVMAAILTMAAAHCNGLMVACANRIGTERGQAFIGQSLIVGSDGWPLAGPASQDQEEILYAAIDLPQIRSGRMFNAFNHVLRDRRTDVYAAMPGTGKSNPL